MFGINDFFEMTKEEISEIYHLPLIQLMHKAAEVHRENHRTEELQISTLVSIKTGGCAEDCSYCPQAARYHTKVKAEDLLSVEEVKQAAQRAKKGGSSRLCMGAAWRNVKNNKEFDQVLEMVKTVNQMELEVCCTLGMITENQAKRLAAAGLYAYNHNIDTSEDYYHEIITTRSYGDRLTTLDNARKAGITICSGGIIGMGESAEDRIGMLYTLSLLNPQPESVPINALVPVEGTPLAEQKRVSSWEMIRMIATTRIVLPKTQVRLSAGRTEMNGEAQALCFLVGANSIFSGDKLLTTPNPEINEDWALMEVLGLQPKKAFASYPQPKIVDLDPKDLPEEKKIRWSRPTLKS
ncbi:MAG: biotin synthase BioB [Bacteroidetes bacterium]|nr:biotin synthase BioB [Bacteroidota bacterium]